jgi:hypothetical protein
MSAPPCREVVIEIEDTKPLLASKVGCIPDVQAIGKLQQPFKTIKILLIKPMCKD